jgi:hypothetical protein
MLTLRKFAYAILIVTITMGGLLFLEGARAATSVSGTIYVDTTWTRANSPYTLTGDVTISNGVTLTVQSGVTVNFGSYQMRVNGILNARGTGDSKIVFSGGYPTSKIVFTSAGSGCIVDNAYISSVSMVVESVYPQIGNPQISNSYFTSTQSVLITVSGGSPSILNNVLNFDSYDCISITGSAPVISYNVIAGKGQNYGIYTEGTATITNNNITGCWTGIYAVGASTIQQNNIMNNGNDGIRSENSASTIQYNVLANNNVGISVTGIIRDNTIANNLVAGIWGPFPSATITQNNIYGNPQNVHLTEPDNIEAAYNWWGTTDASAINQTIWDHKNASNLGTLNFIPYLSESNALAPSIPPLITIPPPPTIPTPTPTVTPTPTPSPTSSVTPTPTSPTLTPSPTATPTETPQESPGQFTITDIGGIVVIVVAILSALIIIVFINRKYGKSQV